MKTTLYVILVLSLNAMFVYINYDLGNYKTAIIAAFAIGYILPLLIKRN